MALVWIAILAAASQSDAAPDASVPTVIQQAPTRSVPKLSPFVTAPLLTGSLVSTGGVTQRTLRTGAGFPAWTGDWGAVVTSAAYRLDRFGGNSLASALPDTLHRFDLSLLGILELAPRWNMVAEARAIYAGELSTLSSRAWQPFARLNFGYALSPRMTLYFGAVLPRTSLGLVPLPALGFVYRSPDGRFRVSAIPPTRVEVSYRVMPWLDLYSASSFTGGLWWVRRQPSADGSSSNAGYLTIERLQTSLGSRIPLGDRFALEAEVGLAAWQRLAVQDLAFETVRSASGRMGFFTSVGLAVQTGG